MRACENGGPSPLPFFCWRWRLAQQTGAGLRQSQVSSQEGHTRTNPGCNYLVRGCSPSMHFFRRVDMLLFPAPLPFWQAEECRGSVKRRAHAFARPARARSRPWLSVPPSTPWIPSSLCSPLSGVVPSFDRYICLAQNIGYVTIKPMTK